MVGGSIEQLSEIELSFWSLKSLLSLPGSMAMDIDEFLGINYAGTTDDFAI